MYHLKRFSGTEHPKSVKMFRENVLSGTELHTALICLTHGGGGAEHQAQKKGDSYFCEPPDNYYEGNLLKVIHFLEIILLAAYYDVLEFLLACAGWNEVTADDILFQTFEVIDAGADCGLAENLGSLLE